MKLQITPQEYELVVDVARRIAKRTGNQVIILNDLIEIIQEGNEPNTRK